MREIMQNPIDWVIKGFGVLSAIAFISSGVANWALFSDLWGVNYFLIANPSDVVMSAFVFASIFAVALLLAAAVMWVLQTAFRIVGRKIETILVRIGHPEPKGRPTPVWAVPVLYGLLTFLFASLMLGGGIVERRPIWYETGLKTSARQQFGDTACGGQRIAWLGSAAAIIDCEGEAVIIHKLDDLQTVPLDNTRTAWLAPPNSPAVRDGVPFWQRVPRA